MKTEFTRVANDAATIATSERWDAVKARIKFLSQNPGSSNGWLVQLFAGLFCQTFSEYLALKRAYQTKESGDAGLLAWRARNLLELSVWATYCGKSRENARRLYQQALFHGTETLERPCQPVSAAAVECGMGEEFSRSYTMLSDFAHPIPEQIVSPDEASEVLQRDTLYREGCLFFCGAFNTLERQLLAQPCGPMGKVSFAQYGLQSKVGGTGGVAQAPRRGVQVGDDEAEITVYG
jgi:hypothetical protein